MKKLRIALIVLFSVLMSLALFACGGGNHTHVDESPKDGNCDECGERMKEAVGTLDSITFEKSIEITDASAQADAESQLNGMKITANYADGVESKQLTSAEYTVDWSGVKFGTYGTYTAVVTPTENNYFSFSGSVTVNIAHDLKEGEAGVRTCSVCGATQRESDINDTFRIEGWGDGVALGDSNEIVKYDSRLGNNTSVVARLDKGMSITLEGYVYSLKEKANSYFYPILGFANIEENGSVIQRNDDWSIYGAMNGVLNAWAGNPFSDQNATVAEFPGAESAADLQVYVSGPWTSSDDLDGVNADGEKDNTFYYKTADGKYEMTQSEGSTLVGVPVKLTWSYSEDCVATMTWFYPELDKDSGGRTRTATVKMPERPFYNAILHGEQVNITFTKMTSVQNLKLDHIDTPTVKEGANFLENTMIDTNIIDVGLHYVGIEKTDKADGGIINLYAHTDETITLPEDNEEKGGRTYAGEGKEPWIDLESTKLSSTYKAFKVRVQIGDDWEEVILSKAEAEKIKIIASATDHTGEKDVTYKGATFLATGLDAVEFAQTSDAKVGITLSGTAVTLTEAQKTALGATGYTSYVNFTLFHNGGAGATTFSGTPTFKSGDTTVPGGYVVSEDGESVSFVLPLNATVVENGITISGVNGADIVVSFGDLIGLEVTSTITANTLKLNEPTDITIVYELGALAPASQADLSDTFQIAIGATTFFFNDAGTGASNSTFRGYPGLTLESSLSGSKLTMKYHVPTFNAASPSDYKFGLVSMDTGATLVSDTVYYTTEFKTGDNALKGDYYVSVDGTKLYITKAYTGDNITNTMLTEQNLLFSANMGNKTAEEYKRYEYLRTFDFGYSVNEAGVASFANSVRAGDSDLATVTAYVFGTINNDTDVDRGALVVVTVDLTKLGIRSTDRTEGFAFNVNSNAEDPDYWYATVTESTVGTNNQVTEFGNEEKIHTGDCLTANEYASLAGNGAFYAKAEQRFENDHNWTLDSKNQGWEVCSACGAGRNYNIDNDGENKVAFGNGLITADQIKAALPEGKTLVETGLMVSFEVGAVTGGDWNTRFLATGKGDLRVTAPNLDAHWHSVDKDVPDLSEREAALATQFIWGGSVNPWPDSGDAFRNGTTSYDEFLSGYCYVTITMSVEQGVRYYKNGVLVYEYTRDKMLGGGSVAEFVEFFLLIAQKTGVRVCDSQALSENAPEGSAAGTPTDAYNVMYAASANVAADVLYTRYTEQFGQPTPPAFITVPAQAENTEELQDTWTEQVEIASAGYSVGKAWYIKRGQKVVVTGTLTGIAADAPNNWTGGGVIFDRVLKPVDDAIPNNGRIDNWENGSVVGWLVEMNPVATEANGDPADDWVAKMKVLRSTEGNVTVFTFDYTDASKLVVTMQISVDGVGSFTQTYTATPLENAQNADGSAYSLDPWLLIGITVDGNGFNGTAVATMAE